MRFKGESGTKQKKLSPLKTYDGDGQYLRTWASRAWNGGVSGGGEKNCAKVELSCSRRKLFMDRGPDPVASRKHGRGESFGRYLQRRTIKPENTNPAELAPEEGGMCLHARSPNQKVRSKRDGNPSQTPTLDSGGGRLVDVGGTRKTNFRRAERKGIFRCV